MTTNDIAGLFMLDFQRIVNQIEHARSTEVRRFVGNYPPVNIIRKDLLLLAIHKMMLKLPPKICN
jgi:hypothetical protein